MARATTDGQTTAIRTTARTMTASPITMTPTTTTQTMEPIMMALPIILHRQLPKHRQLPRHQRRQLPPEGTLAMIPTQTQDTTGTPAMTINRPPLRFRHEYKHLISLLKTQSSPAGSAGFSPGTAMPGPPALTGYAACILILPMTARCAKNLTAQTTGKSSGSDIMEILQIFSGWRRK